MACRATQCGCGGESARVRRGRSSFHLRLRTVPISPGRSEGPGISPASQGRRIIRSRPCPGWRESVSVVSRRPAASIRSHAESTHTWRSAGTRGSFLLRAESVGGLIVSPARVPSARKKGGQSMQSWGLKWKIKKRELWRSGTAGP